MERVDVSITIKAPLEKVFSVISDHSGYGELLGVQSAILLKNGELEKNGKGAVRQLNAPGVTFVEEITKFGENSFYEYKVKECFFNLGFLRIDIPLIHELGRVTCKEGANGILVNWVSIIDMEVPIAREIAARAFAFNGSEAFLFMLRQMKFKLETN